MDTQRLVSFSYSFFIGLEFHDLSKAIKYWYHTSSFPSYNPRSSDLQFELFPSSKIIATFSHANFFLMHLSYFDLHFPPCVFPKYYNNYPIVLFISLIPNLLTTFYWIKFIHLHPIPPIQPYICLMLMSYTLLHSLFQYFIFLNYMRILLICSRSKL